MNTAIHSIQKLVGKAALAIVISSFSINFLYAQTGPGGIGNADGSIGQPKNVMWLDAQSLGLGNNTPVASWTDRSGNNKNATQITAGARPLFRSNYFDTNKSAISFDGTDDFLNFDGSTIVGTDYTVVVVAARRSTGGRKLWMGGTNSGNNTNLHAGWEGTNFMANQWGNDHNGPMTGGAPGTTQGTFGIFMHSLESGLTSAQRKVIQNGTILNSYDNNTKLLSYNGASLAQYAGNYYDVDIAEFILYANALNNAQRIMLDNYLNAKYNIPVAFDLYAGDTPANGDFDYDVIGIGKLNNSDFHSFASAKGLVLNMYSTTAFGNNSGLIAGHDNTANSTVTSNITGTVQERWAKSWYINKTGNTNAEISFDLSEGINGQYPQVASNYVLLFRANNSGNFSVRTVVSKTITNGDQVTFRVSNGNIANGYYTLGTTDASNSPVAGLPGKTWYSYQTGNWNNPTSWTLDGGISPLLVNPNNEVPGIEDDVIITSGRTITMDINDAEVSSIEIIGRLDVVATTGHNFTKISGNGRIRMSGSGGNDNFPGGDITAFANATTGGTVVLYGTGINLNQPHTFNHLIVDLTNAANIVTQLADITLNGNLTVSRGTYRINNNASTTILNAVIKGDLIIDTNGRITTGTGDTRSAYQIGGTMPAIGQYHNIYHQFEVYGNFTNNGSVNFTNEAAPRYNTLSSQGAVTVRFKGSTNNTVDLNGTTNFYNLVVDKGTDQTYVLTINASDLSYFKLFGANNVGRIIGPPFSPSDPEVRKALFIYHGTLRLTGNISIPTLSEGGQVSGNGDYAIGANAALHLDGPNVTVFSTATDNSTSGNTQVDDASGNFVDTSKSNQALSVYGLFKISQGFFGTRNSGGLIFWADNNGTVQVEGGTVDVGQIRSSGPGVTTYVQSGGTMYVRGDTEEDGEVSNGSALFSLDNPSAVFNMSGGDLVIRDVGGAALSGVHISSAEENINVTGGGLRVDYPGGDPVDINSTAPFYNVTMLDGEVMLQTDLVVLNDLTIGSNTRLRCYETSGGTYYNVTIGRDLNIYDNAIYDFGQNTTTFNSSTDGTLYIGDITSLSQSNVDYTDPENDPYPNWEHPFNNFIVNKPNATLTFEAKNPASTGSTGNIKTPTGGKNIYSYRSNLVKVIGDFILEAGTVDIDQYSIRLYGSNITNRGVLGIYEDGTTSKDALIKLRKSGGNFNINTVDGATFGNLRINSGSNIVYFSSNVYVQRMEYRHGRVDISSYNLKIDVFDINLENGETNTSGSTNIFSINDMIITAGNASDGGVSLYVPHPQPSGVPSYSEYLTKNNLYNQPDELYFPLGTSANSNNRYTPAGVVLSNVTDDGYIIINPVDDVLQTSNLSGGNVLSYYWRVRYEGFSALPTVRYNFTYDQSDVSGGENTFVGGKVLDVSPFTRSGENFQDLNKNGSIDGGEGSADVNSVNDGSNTITIDYNGTDNSGFTLEQANYTAGTAARFLGAPRIFYTKTLQAAYSANWENGTLWTFAPNDIDNNGQIDTYELHDSRQPNAGTWPQAGDIAVVGWVPYGDPNYTGGKPHGVEVRNTVNFAELRFNQMLDTNNGNPTTRNYADNFQFRPTVCINPGGSLTGNVIAGEGLFWCRSTGGSQVDPDFSSIDMGGFVAEDSSYLIYESTSNAFVYNNIPSEVANLLIAGDGWGANDRDFKISTDILVKGDFELLGDVNLLLSSGASGDIKVENDLRIFRNNINGNDSGGDGEISFPNDASRTIEVLGNLHLVSTGALINIRNANTTVNVSQLIVHGNILQNSASGNPDGLRLFTATNQDYIHLQLAGSGNHYYTKASGDVLSLYSLLINKGNSITSTFTFNDNFTLNGPTTGTTKALELQNGLLVLDDNAIQIDLSNGGDPFRIPASTGLEVRQGRSRINGNDTGIFLDGLLRLSGGHLDMGCGSCGNHRYLEYGASGNALIEVSAGWLDVGSQIRRTVSNVSGVLKFRQTGGTVSVGRGGSAPINNRGMFEVMNTGSEFTFTGGDFTVYQQNGVVPTVASIILEPTTFDVTGSTINIGGAETPAGQTITINSAIALNNLLVNSTNAPKAQIVNRNLTLNGNLTINTGSTLDANGWNLALAGNMTNNGVFTANSNTTIFNGALAQQISGSSSGGTVFYKLKKSSGNTLSLSNHNISTASDFLLQAGTLNDGGNTITVWGNMVHDGIHITPTTTAGQGIVFAGTSRQELTRTTDGNSQFGKLTINNGAGVLVPDGNGYSFTINEALRLSAGVFDIGGSLLTVSANAIVEEVNTFGTNNMIQTNSSFTDNGVRREFNAISSPTNVIFPVGQTKYTPVIFNVNNSSAGDLTVRPANEKHPSILEDIEAPDNEIVDASNALQYHWIISASGIGGFSGNAVMTYDPQDVAVTSPYTVSNYIPARLFEINVNWDKAFSTSAFDEGNKKIIFPFSNASDATISGDYTAGVGANNSDVAINGAIPDQVPVYETLNGGNYDNTSGTWSTPIPVGGPIGAIITVKNGDVLTFNKNDIRVYRTIIEAGGTLVVDGTIGHRLGTVMGNGIIKISSNTTSAVLPAGYYNDFISCTGGGLEYAGTGNYDILGGISSLRSLTVSGSGTRALPSNNITICDDLTVSGPTLNNGDNRVVTVQDNMIINSGTYNSNNGTLSITNDLTVSGGTFNGGTGEKTVNGDLNLSAGTLDAGSGGTFTLRGDMTYSGGNFAGGSGSAVLALAGSSLQNVYGNYTTASFYRLRVNNAAGVRFNGNVTIAQELQLTNGIVNPLSNTFLLSQVATVDPVGGSSSSYVNGRVSKLIPNTGSFTFPIGNGGRYGKASVSNISAPATYTWYAQYYNGDAVSQGAVTNFTATDPSATKTISGNEYWRIGDNAPGGTTITANVGLRWDDQSEVSANPADHTELHVVAWDNNTSGWDDYRGTSFSGTTFISADKLSFSENIVTLGSGSEMNPLPVEVISFSVKMEDKAAMLHWATASEKNNDFFEVQRSVNGQEWKSLGTVKGAGDSYQELSYSFTDKNPHYGISYYRLLQVDFDGQFEYSNVVVLENFADDIILPDADVLLYPNPASLDELIIRALNLQPWQEAVVSLSDVYGKQYVYALVNPEDLEKGIKLDKAIHLPSGLYLVTVKQGSVLIQKKLILKK